MGKTNKKGFTIVELVIVIAVIAILAAVLIPNLSRLVGKANESSAMQAARNEYQAYLAEYAKDLDGTEKFVIIKGKYAFEVNDGQFEETAKEATSYTVTNKTDLSKVYVKAGESATAGYTYANGVYTPVTSGATYVLASPVADLGSTEVAIYVNQ